MQSFFILLDSIYLLKFILFYRDAKGRFVLECIIELIFIFCSNASVVSFQVVSMSFLNANKRSYLVLCFVIFLALDFFSQDQRVSGYAYVMSTNIKLPLENRNPKNYIIVISPQFSGSDKVVNDSINAFKKKAYELIKEDIGTGWSRDYTYLHSDGNKVYNRRLGIIHYYEMSPYANRNNDGKRPYQVRFMDDYKNASDVNFWLNRAAYHIKNSNFREAIEFLDKIVKAKGKTNSLIESMYFKSYFPLGEDVKTREHLFRYFETAQKDDPDYKLAKKIFDKVNNRIYEEIRKENGYR